MIEKSYRSIAKSGTWRALAFLDTTLLAFIFTGDIGSAFTISGFELLTKTTLYYLHERGWLKYLEWQKGSLPSGSFRTSRTYSMTKTVTWRIVGSFDTFVISYVVTGHLGLSASIGGVEVITKSVLYYMHERVWASTRWGIHTPEEYTEKLPDPLV